MKQLKIKDNDQIKKEEFFDIPGLFVCVRNTVQLVDPPEYLAVCKRYDFVITPCLVDLQCQLPTLLPEPAAVNFIYKLLAN